MFNIINFMEIIDDIGQPFVMEEKKYVDTSILKSPLDAEELKEYIKFRNLNDVMVFISRDIRAKLDFTNDGVYDGLFNQYTYDAFVEEIKEKPNGYKKNYILHTVEHTLAMLRENNTFFIIDSYYVYTNCLFKVIPLLELIKKVNSKANLYILNDMMQNDFISCRIFSVETIRSYMKYTKERNISLTDFINESKEYKKINKLDFLRYQYSPEKLNVTTGKAEKIGLQVLPIHILFSNLSQRQNEISFAYTSFQLDTEYKKNKTFKDRIEKIKSYSIKNSRDRNIKFSSKINILIIKFDEQLKNKKQQLAKQIYKK